MLQVGVDQPADAGRSPRRFAFQSRVRAAGNAMQCLSRRLARRHRINDADLPKRYAARPAVLIPVLAKPYPPAARIGAQRKAGRVRVPENASALPAGQTSRASVALVMLTWRPGSACLVVRFFAASRVGGQGVCIVVCRTTLPPCRKHTGSNRKHAGSNLMSHSDPALVLRLGIYRGGSRICKR